MISREQEECDFGELSHGFHRPDHDLSGHLIRLEDITSDNDERATPL